METSSRRHDTTAAMISATRRKSPSRQNRRPILRRCRGPSTDDGHCHSRHLFWFVFVLFFFRFFIPLMVLDDPNRLKTQVVRSAEEKPTRTFFDTFPRGRNNKFAFTLSLCCKYRLRSARFFDETKMTPFRWAQLFLRQHKKALGEGIYGKKKPVKA